MIDIFIAYSHNDLPYKDELKKFLRPLLREGRISMWDDFDIEAGADWDAAIKQRLYGADLVLLLVSADSLASDYFYSKEVKVSLERHERGEAVVVPVILRHCDWAETPLGTLEALPEKGRPVVDWPTRDQAMQDIVSRLRRVVEGVERKKKAGAAQADALRHFQAACLAADHLWQKKNWAEARAAYAVALAAHQPGFAPDRAALSAKMADCDTGLRAEKAEREDIVKREREAETKRQRAEKEQLAQAQREQQPTASGNTRLFTAIGAGAVLVLALLLWQTRGRSDGKPEREQQQPTTEQPKNDTKPTDTKPDRPAQPTDQTAFDEAQRLGTVRAWREFLNQYPNSPKRKAAQDAASSLKNRIATLLKEANAYIGMDAPDRARPLLQKVLQLDPDNTTAKTKLNALK